MKSVNFAFTLFGVAKGGASALKLWKHMQRTGIYGNGFIAIE
ncbi:hypothetical protein [Mucilaginibacter sp.]